MARDPRCPDCGRNGKYRDTVTRPLTDLPVAGYPLVLQVAVPRYRCTTIFHEPERSAEKRRILRPLPRPPYVTTTLVKGGLQEI